MNRVKLLILTVIMSLMLMVPASAATSSPSKPALESSTTNIMFAGKKYKKNLKTTVTSKYNKKYNKRFYIKVASGASVKSLSKNMIVQRVSATKYRIIIKKGTRFSSSLKVTKKNHKSATIKVKVA